MKYKDKITTMVQDVKNQTSNIHKAVGNNSITVEELSKSLAAISKKLENISELISLESYSR